MNSLHTRVYLILDGAWRRRYAILIPILIFPIFGVVISALSPKHYASHTSMLIQETAKLNPFLADLAVSAMLKERISALKTLLHSRHILGTVALEIGLVNDQTTAQEHDQVIAQLSNALSINMLGKDLIRIDYQAGNPQGMKEMLQSVSQQFIEQVLAPERSSMTDSTQFLAEHLHSRQTELDKAELAIAQFIDQHATELPELHLGNIAHLSKLKERLSEREAEMAGASRSLGGLSQQLSKSNPIVGLIEEKIIRLQGEMALLRARYTDQHSSVLGALRKLQRLEKERQQLIAGGDDNISLEKLWVIGSTYSRSDDPKQQPLLISQLDDMQQTRSRVDGLREEIKSLNNMIETLQIQMSGYGENASTLAKLQRELSIKRDLYDDILLRFEKANITASLGVFEQDKRVKIIDRPFTPTAPTNKPLLLFIISGFLGGLFLGCGLAVVLEVSDSRLRRRDQLQTLTGVPVLSRIPFIRADSGEVL
ncbi:MAG: polysaccharide chain length determinant protein (PEP-CTERM system associated) [Psychromonas sp.]|jgi:polysaccharide chain length determinant protein (PEP-CTERM system associated)|uniref:chain-length determining protein n=1 Tax=Psychromonas sp. TaxID=1884585 RepID=UPI0039E257A9